MERFGNLTVIESYVIPRKPYRRICVCKCDCGKTKEIRRDALISGKTISCGCAIINNNKKMFTKHLLSHHRLYVIWQGMRQRCSNPNHIAFSYYGGRGIKVCNEWSDFMLFYEWAMNNGYKENLTIDRIDNDKDYYPDNCRWLTSEENTILAHKGKHHDMSHPKHPRKPRSDKGIPKK
jgi:hypothetical protein